MLGISRRRERGQVMMFAALLAPILLGMTGMAIDIGRVVSNRRDTQNAADAAALAGASVLLGGGTTSAASTAALSWAQKNGYDATKTTVHIPPSSGAHAGNSQYVEVSITTTTPTLFMKIVRINSTTEQGRAVAGYKTTPKNYALLVLNKTACSAYNQSSNQTLTINGGGMMVNSSCNPSGDQGGGGIVGADYIDFYSGGTWKMGNNVADPVPPSPVSAQVSDPLAALPRPIPCTSTTIYTPAGCNVLQSTDSGGSQASPSQYHLAVNNNSPTQLHPGVYWGGLKISGNGGASVTFLPGTYIFAGGGGGFDYSGTANLSGNGVTFFNTDDPQASSAAKRACGAFSLTGNGILNFSAPTSGTWKSMLFWQADVCTQTPYAASCCVFSYGGGNNTTAGVIYLPTAQLSVSGGGNLGAVQIIVDTFKYSGGAPVTINYTPYVPADTPRLALVE